MAPLASWGLKLDRADSHIRQLDDEIAKYIDRDPYSVIRSESCDLHPACWRFVLRIEEQPDPRLAVMLGDAVHNMRSALDHIAVAIAPESKRREASFPIFVDRRDRQFDRRTAGMSPRAVTIIRRYQPYRQRTAFRRRMHALAVLAAMNNADKHSSLVVVGTGLSQVTSEVTARGHIMKQSHEANRVVQDGGEVAHFADLDPPLNAPEVSVQTGGYTVVSLDTDTPEVAIDVAELWNILGYLKDTIVPALEPWARR